MISAAERRSMGKLILPLLLLTAVFARGAETFPAIPEGMIERYSAEPFAERVESFAMERLLLKGRHPILMDYIPGHRFVGNSNASAFFDIRFNPGYQTSFFVFPENTFGAALSPESLNLYLRGKATKAPPVMRFEIIENASPTTGPAKFRIFGMRALTIRYTHLVEGKAVTTGENWIENDGTIFVVTVRAPSEGFERYFERVRVALSSMNLVE